MEEKRYEIGGKIYIQRPLVLGQVQQLLVMVEGTQIPADANMFGIVTAVGDKLFLALAIVLTEEGKSPRDKDFPALADEIEFSILPEQTITVIEDFFDCNPLFSILERVAGMTKKFNDLMSIGLRNSAFSSAMETSPGETGSSGEQPSKMPRTGRKKY